MFSFINKGSEMEADLKCQVCYKVKGFGGFIIFIIPNSALLQLTFNKY